jgi:heat shock protein HslJ
MPNIRDRFHAVDLVEPPDVFSDALRREPSGPVIGDERRTGKAAVIAVSLIVAVIAIGFATRAFSSGTATPGAAMNVPSDPCDLVTGEQVAQATGGRVTSIQQLDRSDYMVPPPSGTELPCEFVTNSPFRAIVVSTGQDTTAFDTVQSQAGRSVVPISGLGDEAFVDGKASMWVRVGDSYFSITAQQSSGDAAVAMFTELAQDALRSPQVNSVASPTDVSSRPLSFTPADGWYDKSYRHKAGSSDPSQAWTSNTPFAPGVQPPAFPDTSALAEGQVLVLAWQVVNQPPDPNNPNFPVTEGPVQLAEPSTGYEGMAPGITRSMMLAQVNGRYIQIEVYFGSEDPSSDMKSAAQAALDRLVVSPSLSSSPRSSVLSDALVGTQWMLTTVDGRQWPFHGMHRVSLSFETLHADRLGGYNGCNEYGAQWAISARDLTLSGQLLHVTGYGQTSLYCGGKSGWIEKRFAKVLRSDARARLGTDELRLSFGEGILVFSPM